MFYYVLNGRIQKLREYQLTSGCVNKCMGYLNKGMTSNTDDLIKNRPREYHLVAKGPVEVLILHREDFMRLQNTTHGPPVDFLKTVDLFSEFPCEEFLSHPDAIEYRYYGQNKIIAKDALDTPWIHVIKSGEVKVVRIQYVIDVSNDSIFEGQTTEELGCGRSFSHASAMLGVLAKQRQLKLQTLKENEQECDISESQETQNMKMVHKKVLPPCREILPDIPQICVQGEITLPNIRRHNKDVQAMDDSIDISGKISRSKSVSLPPIVQASIVAPRVGEGFHPHGTFLTREKTDNDVVYSKGNRKKEQTHRRAYLQLDTLSAGDIFGLETLETSNDIFNEGPAVSLMSDGAEVVKISKRFFLQHAQNNTILKVETMQRQFLTTEEVKSILYDQETWTQYKQILMQRLTTALSPRKSHVSLGS
ncbi:uncharacterized protein LOC126830283 [Patella vulgata]|uniref:uncharacterized protein LOC126830283 n=1 Tax=Patella vulgata TaxID=6465 RepID=UPI00217F848F|nr:uncharacterized protein LOC126830283 [Patella vulgata]